MQATRVQQRVVFGGTRAVVLAAAAVIGVGIGYWVLPQDGEESAGQTAATQPVSRGVASRADRITALKTEQMDRADAAFGHASQDAEALRAAHITALKSEQMERADAAFGQGAVAGVSTSPGEAARTAAEKARGDRIWAVKFQQMDEADSR